MADFASQSSTLIGEGGKIQVQTSPSSLVFYINDPVSHKQMLTIYNPYDFVVNFKIYSTAPSKYSVLEPNGAIQTKKCIDLAIRHKEPTLENEGKVDKFRVSFTAQANGQTLAGRKDIPSTLLYSSTSSRAGNAAGNRRSIDLDRNASFDSSTSEWIYQHRRSTGGGGGGPGSVAGDLHQAAEFSDARTNEVNGGQMPHPRQASSSSLWLLAAVGLVCVMLLCLPTRSNNNCPQQQNTKSTLNAAEQSIWAVIWPFSGGLPESLEVSHNCQLVAAYILGLISLAILR